MTERYKENLGAFLKDELAAIRGKSVCVIGCGGLGGFVCGALARFGVGALTVADGDCFSESNLNRQMFASPGTLGKNKAEICAGALFEINPDVTVKAVSEMLTAQNAEGILAGHDLVMDCLDNAQSRILLEALCERLELPIIHGAISGFMGQVAVAFPGSGLIKRLYSGLAEDGKAPGKPNGSPVFTAQAVSALQCAEALKLLAGRKTRLWGKLLHINLEENAFQILTV